MKNHSIVALLTVIAVLLGANLIVTASSAAWAQERERQPERPVRPQSPADRQPQRPQAPAARDQDRPTRPGMAQRPPRCVGITTVGSVVVLAFDDGTIETREVPAAPSR